MAEPEHSRGGIFASFRRLFETAVASFQNRFELFAVEVQEEKDWLIAALLWTAAVIFSGLLAILVITATIVFAVPEGVRLYVLVGFSVLYILLAVLTVLGLKRHLKSRQAPFSETISELKKDLASFRRPEE